MKKRAFALLFAAIITVSSAIPALADTRESPTNVTITPTPTTTVTATPTPSNPPKSPKTGEIDYILYGGLSAAAFASVAVLSKRKKDGTNT